MPQQVAHLLEARLPRELADVVPAVGEPTIGAVQVAESGLDGDDAPRPGDELAAFRHGFPRRGDDGAAPAVRRYTARRQRRKARGARVSGDARATGRGRDEVPVKPGGARRAEAARAGAPSPANLRVQDVAR